MVLTAVLMNPAHTNRSKQNQKTISFCHIPIMHLFSLPQVTPLLWEARTTPPARSRPTAPPPAQ